MAAIGITDYFLIDGYRSLRTLIADAARLESLVGSDIAAKARALLVIPNIELRSSTIVRYKGKDSRVNFHVLFSPDLTPDEIEEHFLRDLRFTSEAAPDDRDNRLSLTSANLNALGKRLKEEQLEFRSESDLVVGMVNAVVAQETVTNSLEQQWSRFRDRYLIVLAADEDLSKVSWGGQGHLSRKLMVQKAHMLFSANPSTREFGLGQRHATVESFRTEFKSFKPCIHGSDAHDFPSLYEPADRRYTWIKADPTWRGLRQVLHEPADRVFIGELPPALASRPFRATKVIDQISVQKTPTATTREAWFEVEDLPITTELAAIIGNKGSGKSALADIFGLLGATRNADSFSFLRADRFRNPRDAKARQFAATMTWADGTVEGPVSLDQNPETSAPERVRYIPQGYLEEICNEIGTGSDTKFYSELQGVIFSHVPSGDRLGHHTLESLLTHLGDGIDKAISLRKVQIQSVSKELGRAEKRLEPTNRTTITRRLGERERELVAHIAARPAAVTPPEEDKKSVQAQQETTKALEEAKAEVIRIEGSISKLRAEDSTLALREAAAERVIAAIRNGVIELQAVVRDLAGDLRTLGLGAEKLVAIQVDYKPLEAIIKDTRARRTAIATELNTKTAGGLEQGRIAAGQRVVKLTSALSEPQRRYQAHLAKVAEWEKRQAAIIGTVSDADSIAQLKAELDDLDGLPSRCRKLKSEMRRLSLQIYVEKERLRQQYERYHGAVQEFLATHPIANSEGFRLTFQAAHVESGFAEGLLDLIDQRRSGPFAGTDEAQKAIARRLAIVDWCSPKSVLTFVEAILSSMSTHQGTSNPREQLRAGVGMEAVWEFMYSLDYITPIYQLQWDGKGLDELSPGERGNLLLIFYLLVDREDIPLVIDQPEENLDNQTIVRTLVPCMKDAKLRRQVIMVTHNPNLAVVCDADQIIYAALHKDGGNRIEYVSGSIEDPIVNQHIIDVLEGTKPAFEQRDARYHA